MHELTRQHTSLLVLGLSWFWYITPLIGCAASLAAQRAKARRESVGGAAPVKSHRLFFAVWPDDATSQELARLQSRVRGRKTHRDDFHITLAFLGERPVDSLPILKEILARLDPIDMTLVLDRLGYFRHNRIAWIGMETPPPALFQLHDKLRRELTGRSILFSGYGDFRPHITLARNADAPDEEPFAPIAWRARRIALAESLPASEGARYRLLAEVRSG